MTFFIYLPLLLGFVVLGVYAERKIAGFVQDRLGPMHVGPIGLFQTIADLLKMLQKEDITPSKADKWVFKLAPFVIFSAIFVGFSGLPLSIDLTGSGLNTGIFFLLSFISLDVIGVLMAGWSSNNKYSLYGAMRSVAQIISYEVPLGLSVLCVVMLAQSLDLNVISLQQGILYDKTNYLFGLPQLGINVSDIGGFTTWNIVRAPFFVLLFIMFFVASLAEANRAPFDLPESESELIGGYHTEYSGFRWGIVMLSEYGMMLLTAILAAILFLGSWNTALPNMGSLRLADWTTGTPGNISASLWGGFWLLSKTLVIVLFQMMARWTYPRLRVDQLMSLGWKYLTPFGLLMVLITAIWRLLMSA